MPRFNQYIKKVSYNGITFDSKEELEYYLLLLDRQEKGEIEGLEKENECFTELEAIM